MRGALRANYRCRATAPVTGRSTQSPAHSLRLPERCDAIACVGGASLRGVAGRPWPTAQAVLTSSTNLEAEVQHPVVAMARSPVISPVAVRHDFHGCLRR